MIHLHSNRTDTPSYQPPKDADLDAFLIDDEFDDLLDSQIASLRELADLHNI